MSIDGFKFHRLANGEVVCITSAHGFKFSDGTEATEGATKEAAHRLDVDRVFVPVEGKDRVTHSIQRLPEDALQTLAELNSKADWVLVSFMVVSALWEMGLRDDPRFSNVVANNSTKETARATRPSEKVVDINNWAW